MLLGHLILTLTIGLVLAALVGANLRFRQSPASLGLLVTAMALAVWTAGLWSPPVGPALFGLYPFPFILAGIVVALAFLALLSSGYGRPAPVRGDRPRNVPRLLSRRPVTLTVLLWFVIVALLCAIAIRYLGM
jgi:hypothetical protein